MVRSDRPGSDDGNGRERVKQHEYCMVPGQVSTASGLLPFLKTFVPFPVCRQRVFYLHVFYLHKVLKSGQRNH